MIYFNEPFLTLHWEDQSHCIVAEWKSTPSLDQFQRGLNKGAELVAIKRASRWLADTRNLGILTPAHQQWTVDVWFPLAARSGVRTMALIIPKSAVVTLSLRHLINQVNGVLVETQYFDTVDAGRAWLLSR